MLFTSWSFLPFFISVWLLVYLLDRQKRVALRNSALLLASYGFYAYFSWLFLAWLGYITAVNYIGVRLLVQKATTADRKKYMWAIVGLSIAPLLGYKYADALWEASTGLLAYTYSPLKWLMPVGLSFFTFQALSYMLDVYRKKIDPTDFLSFALSVAFFPTILSGPIERPRNLFPQWGRLLSVQAKDVQYGLLRFSWGLFKKAVIADRLSQYVNIVYADTNAYSGATLLLAALLYAFQIYADFSGYSDMAIGVARSMGIRLMENFQVPYAATSIKEFWKRWHISLTSWFTEYVYIGLGGNRVSQGRWIGNIAAVFLLSGIWHGATFSFLIWGGLHAVYYLGEHYLQRTPFAGKLPKICSWSLVFILVAVAWIFFRIEDSLQAWQVLGRIVSDKWSMPYLGSSTFAILLNIVALAILWLVEWQQYRGMQWFAGLQAYTFPLATAALWVLVALLGVSGSQFVYFQF